MRNASLTNEIKMVTRSVHPYNYSMLDINNNTKSKCDLCLH